MRLPHPAKAGSLESCDCHVTAEPADALTVAVESPALAMFGRRIREVALETAASLGVTGVALRVVDRGALDPVLAARVEACLRRGLAGGEAAR